MIFKFASHEISSIQQEDIINLLFIGFKFDVRIASIAFGSLLLLSLLMLFSKPLYDRWRRYLRVLSVLFSLIIFIFTLVNIGYFSTYNRHIDVFVFGLIDDDTVAVLQTVWQDYPVISGTILLVVVLFCFIYFYKYWQSFVSKRTKKITSNFLAIPATFIVLLITFIGCRGSLDKFPLRKSDAQVSSNNTINMFVPNGVMAFNWAYADYQVQNSFEPVSSDLSKRSLAHFFGAPQETSIDVFTAQTLSNEIAKNKPPHVVLSVMESMGTHLFEFNNKERDLLGALEPHLQEGWTFPRFISEGDGTIDSLNRFFVRSPISKISQSSAQFSFFKSNMFRPFLDNGYKVIFITPGNGAWRNLNQFLPHLGVVEFVELNTLKSHFPEAPIGTWGIDDEYMFKYAQYRLKKAEEDSEHVMIMMMSVTNHPPFRVPSNHIYHDYKLTDDEKVRLKNFGPEEESIRMLNTFRYSNDQLGQFISWVKNENLADHTIVAFTGDHNMRGIGYPDPKEAVLSHAVPFYLYVPDEYKQESFYDKNRLGSHKDIFPTLYQLSLSKTDYYQTGCNLLAKNLNPVWCNVGYNPYVFINKEGAYLVDTKEFRPWSDDERLGLRLGNPTTLTQEEQDYVQRWSSFTTLLQWQIVEQINSKKGR